MRLLVLLALLSPCVAGANAIKHATSFVSLKGDRVEFRANETTLFVVNKNFTGDYRTCLQYHAFVEGKRTKLNAFLCRLKEGGGCSWATVRETNGQSECHVLRPWMKSDDQYAVYFAFGRRLRHWHEWDDHDSRMRLRRRRHSKSTRTVGVLVLDGPVDCMRACEGEDGGSGSGALA